MESDPKLSNESLFVALRVHSQERTKRRGIQRSTTETADLELGVQNLYNKI
jgi:hypothetical protein